VTGDRRIKARSGRAWNQGHLRLLAQSVAVNHYYFYAQDRDWGPAFLKIGTCLYDVVLRLRRCLGPRQ
jgi:hypothetical protein